MSKKVKIKITNKKLVPKIKEDNSYDKDIEIDIQNNIEISEPIPHIDNVYLMRVGNKNVYKIGHSKDPKERLKDIQTSNYKPIFLIACCPGGSSLEKYFHNKYSSENIHLEWFRFDNKQLKEILEEYTQIRLSDKEKIKIKNIRSFKDSIDYTNCTEKFNSKYKCDIKLINLDKVKEVVEYIKRKPYFVMVDGEDLTISSYNLKCFLSRKKIIDKYNCDSNIQIILACYLLGCKIYNIHKGYESICNIGLIVKIK